MKNQGALPGRGSTGGGLLLAIGILLLIDLWQAEPIDPYQAPWPTALGSGQGPSGAHCTDLTIDSD